VSDLTAPCPNILSPLCVDSWWTVWRKESGGARRRGSWIVCDTAMRTTSVLRLQWGRTQIVFEGAGGRNGWGKVRGLELHPETTCRIEVRAVWPNRPENEEEKQGRRPSAYLAYTHNQREETGKKGSYAVSAHDDPQADMLKESARRSKQQLRMRHGHDPVPSDRRVAPGSVVQGGDFKLLRCVPGKSLD